MTIEMVLAFILGIFAGVWLAPKDKDSKEQKEIYDQRVEQYQKDIEYYKDLCKWHVERNRQ